MNGAVGLLIEKMKATLLEILNSATCCSTCKGTEILSVIPFPYEYEHRGIKTEEAPGAEIFFADGVKNEGTYGELAGGTHRNHY